MSIQFVAALEAEMASLREALRQDLRYIRLREIERLRELYREPGEATQGIPTASPLRGTNEVRQASKPPVRQASPERARAIEAARLYVTNRAGPVPTADIFEHVSGLDIKIRGENPVNNLSAMLSNSGIFQANGRAGWTLRRPEDTESSELEEEDVDDDEQRATEQAERSAEIQQEDLDDDIPLPPPPPPPTAEHRTTLARTNYDLDDDIPF